ncbi:ABC transporter permease [Changchengzhania lutea]|uniref:ABC transporter permease n=1 Tax=Changchengzhania lutea TaxID=2049305 RepID=UPI00115F05E1|nr:ABC transporter permease [Changchengzhania lutea]
MIRNYFKQVYRQALRYRLNSSINLFGLSVGIACCVIIFLFVDNEMRYDKFHADTDQIYRITVNETSEGSIRNFANSFLPYAPLLKSQLSEVDEVVRLFPQSVTVANKEKNIVLQEEKFFYADSTLFDVFSFKLLQGDTSTVLNEPHNILLTEATAKKYFGTTNAMGKELLVEQNVLFIVAGIFKEQPSQSTIQFDMIVPMSAAKEIMGSWIADPRSTWHYPPIYSFVKWNESIQPNAIQKRLHEFDAKHLPSYITKSRSHDLQKMEEVHFSNLENEMHTTIDKKILYIFIAAGIVILLIAAFNFINLFLARIVLRFKEVGIKKVLGATRGHIWKQTLIESLFYLFIALLLALLWCFLFLPSFNTLMDTQLNLFLSTTTKVWMVMGLLLAALGFLIALVPTMFLFRFNVISTLKGFSSKVFKNRASVSLQSVLIVFQFFIAVVLIIATLVMQSQMAFIKTKNLGFSKDQVLILPVRDENIQNNFDVVKNKLMQINSVSDVSAISNFPWQKGYYDFETIVNYKGVQTKANTSTILVDENFITAMGMTMVKGRGFSRQHSTDSSTAFIMNESAAQKFGIQDHIGVGLEMENISKGASKKGKLVGVVKDFHLQSLHKKVEPLILTLSPETYYTDNMIIKFSGNDIESTLNSIKVSMQEISPARPFDYFFLDEAFKKLYKKEARINTLFNYFSILSIIIACLGLFGIVAFTTSQRIKEIGIRKILGASVTSIVKLLTSGFLKLVFIAIVIAIPIAYWMMTNWLENFTYRININWWLIISAGMIALSIAVLTIGYQAIRSALSNPTDSLRTE